MKTADPTGIRCYWTKRAAEMSVGELAKHFMERSVLRFEKTDRASVQNADNEKDKSVEKSHESTS